MRSFLLAVLALALPAAAAAEAPPWERAFLEAPPAEVLAAAGALPAPVDGKEIEVLLEEGRYAFDEEGRRTWTYRLVYRPLTSDAARRWSTAAASWEPWRQDRPELRARVITTDGLAHPLDPATLGEATPRPDDPALYDDRRSLRGPLPAIAAGAVVETETVIRDRAPLLAAGEFYRFWFRPGLPTRRVRLVIEAPSTLPLRHRPVGFALAPREEVRGGRRTIVYEEGPVGPFPPEAASLPPALADARSVAVSTGRSWAEVAKGYRELVEPRLAGADVAAFVAGLDRKAGRDAIVAALLARLGERIRYAGVEFGEAAIVPRTPAEVQVRRYGDCKDLSALLVAALRALGFEAHLALVSAGESDPLEDLPGLGAFDHAIVHLPAKPARFVDPTAPGNRGRFLPHAVEDRLALVISPGTKGLVRTGVAPASTHEWRTRVEYAIPETGPAKVVHVEEATGRYGVGLAEHFAGMTEAERKEWLEAYASDSLGAERVASWSYEAGDGTAPRFRVELEGSSRVRAGDDEITVTLPWGVVLELLPDEVTEEDAPVRTEDLRITPQGASVVHRVAVPPGFALRERPADLDLPLGPFRLAGRVGTPADGVVEVAFRLAGDDRTRLPAAEAEALRQAIAALESTQLTLTFDRTAAVLASRGDVVGALAELRRLVALHPGEALHHAQLARLLLDVGLGEAARAEARRAIEVEPGSTVGHLALAWILQHDLLGRRFHRGWDRAGALAAYERAKELDPKAWIARADRAILLEYDGDGVRYGRTADLPAAADEYRAVRDEHGLTGLDRNLLMNLLRSGHAAEVPALAKTIEAGPFRNGIWVAAVAATQGTDAALKQAAALASPGDDRRAILAAAAGHLLHLRRYPEASALFAQAAVGSDDAHALQMQAALFGRVRRFEESRPDPRDPGAMGERMFRAIFAADVDVEGLKALLDPSLLSEEDSFDDVRAMVGGLRRPGDEGIEPRVILDIFLAVVEKTLEGDAQGGWRLRLRGPGGSGVRTTQLYLADRDGGTRIVAFDSEPAHLALEILRRIEAGDRGAALRWSRWYLDVVGRAASGEIDTAAALRRVVTRGDEASDAEIRRAALATAARATDELLPRALAARDEAGEEEALALDQTLVAAAAARKAWPETLALAERISRALPEARMTFQLRKTAYVGLDRARDGLAALERDAGRHPSLRASLAALAVAAGELDAAERTLRDLLDAGEATASVLNSLAWLSLFRPDLGDDRLDEALDQARKASRLDKGNRAILHTLATLLAEAGKSREAIETLRASIAAQGGDPEGADWYVVGRVAEHLGFPAEAEAAYRRVERPARPAPDDTCHLAAARLGALGAKR